MNRACVMIRESLRNKREAFLSGLAAAGFHVKPSIPDPRPGDVLVIWNRYAANAETAKHYERVGASVLVVENGYLGKEWLGETWLAMALGHHAGAGMWREGGSFRWDALGLDLAPFRAAPGELVVLGQRGIGEAGIASPPRWAELTQKRIGGRIRVHPGKEDPAVPLERDLKRAAAVATWHSGAALHAMIMGIPVWYEFRRWIGAEAGKPIEQYGEEPNRDADSRLAMFRRLAWAQWRLSEIASGEALAWLLEPNWMEAAA